MIGKNFIFDSVSIPYTTAEGIAAGWYADIDWTDVRVRNQQLPRQDFHGVHSFPTFAEGRLINITGNIFDSNKTIRGTIRNIVKNLFVIADFPATDDVIKDLAFTDDDGTEWFIRCKVYNMPDFSHSRSFPIINFSVQLFAEDPLIRSKLINSVSGSYGLWGGTVLPVTLPVQLIGSVNYFAMTNAGNFSSPVKATVNVPSSITSAQNIDIFQPNQNSASNLGDVAANERYSYRFTPTEADLGAVTVYINKTGSPIDFFTVEIQSDSAGSPSGTVLASQTVNGTALTTTHVETIFALPVTLTLATPYHVVLKRNGALDAVNYYGIRHSDVDDASSDGNKYNAGWAAWNRQLYGKTHYANSIINPKIYNLTTGTFFKINQTLKVGQELIIDTELVTAEVDEVNALADRATGSNWLFAKSGVNNFLLAGDNFDINNTGMATLDIEFYDTNL